MAESGVEVGILIRIGDGEPTEVTTTTVPLRARFQTDESDGKRRAYVAVDHEAFTDRISHALYILSHALPAAVGGE